MSKYKDRDIVEFKVYTDNINLNLTGTIVACLTINYYIQSDAGLFHVSDANIIGYAESDRPIFTIEDLYI